MNSRLDLLSTIDILNSARETSLLFGLLAKSMQQIGFDRLNFYSLSCNYPDQVGGKVRWSRNYPEGYAAENIDQLLEVGDPVVCSAYNLDSLCEWSALANCCELPSDKQQLLAEREAEGLHAGASIPLRAAYGVLASLEIASSLPGTVFSERSLSEASIVAVHFFKCFSSMHYPVNDTKPVRLTATEREVLFLISRGRTKSDAAAELGVTSYAVDFHCRNIMKKFSTNKMIVAVVSALQFGLLPNNTSKNIKGKQ